MCHADLTFHSCGCLQKAKTQHCGKARAPLPQKLKAKCKKSSTNHHIATVCHTCDVVDWARDASKHERSKPMRNVIKARDDPVGQEPNPEYWDGEETCSDEPFAALARWDEKSTRTSS